MTNDALRRIQRLFSERLNLPLPPADTDLLETGVLDSLTFVELLTHLEQEFGLHVALDDLDIDHFRTPSRIADFVARQLAPGQG